MNNKMIIIRVDGGICSQISFVALGLYLLQKFANQGVIVKYDLSWFKDIGVDLTGKFARNWDFSRAFPKISVELASKEEINYYRRKYNNRGPNCKDFKPPLYVDGYPDVGYALDQVRDCLREAFQPQLGQADSEWARKVGEYESCAIHVRRGDLSVFNVAYGNPASLDYFAKSISLVRLLHPNVKFFFFSDELNYVKSELLPMLPQDLKYEIVHGNGSDRGYMDLFLISRCDYIISSTGSLGVYGADLSCKCKLLVLNRNRDYCFQYMKNVIYLNDSYHQCVGDASMRKHGIWRIPWRVWKWLDCLLKR